MSNKKETVKYDRNSEEKNKKIQKSVGDFNTPLLASGKTEISKYTEELNNTIHKLYLIDMYRFLTQNSINTLFFQIPMESVEIPNRGIIKMLWYMHPMKFV